MRTLLTVTQFKYSMTTWIENWQSTQYQLEKQREIALVLAHLQVRPPRIMLEIGSGLAQDSRMMQQQWGCECVLLEVDRAPEDRAKRHKDYGDVNSMQAYHDLADLTATLDRDYADFKYHMLDGRNLARGGWRFDLVYSNRSWGWHYPIETYRDWIAEHSHEHTVMIAQLRRGVTHPGIRVQHSIVTTRDSEIAQFVWV